MFLVTDNIKHGLDNPLGFARTVFDAERILQHPAKFQSFQINSYNKDEIPIEYTSYDTAQKRADQLQIKLNNMFEKSGTIGILPHPIRVIPYADDTYKLHIDVYIKQINESLKTNHAEN